MRLIVFSILTILSLAASADERILNFHSDIIVHKDATLTVHETIKVQCELKAIRHGITREFPTRYVDRFQNSHNVSFNVTETRFDTKPVPMKQENRSNGIVLYLGDPNSYVLPGIHTYEIVYTTDRQLGFFPEFDELYWNVTGNGWRFSIEKASARITLPGFARASEIKIAAYTGYQGQRRQDFRSSAEESSSDKVTQIAFATTRPLSASEGFTIAVGWPKGLVEEPTFIQEAGWLLRDNLGVGLLLAGILVVFLIYLRSFRATQRANRPGTIIPLFHPPKGMLPSQMRYLWRKGYDATTFACEIVNLAVGGFLTIHFEKGFWRTKYSVRQGQLTSSLSRLQQDILDTLFADSDTYSFEKSSQTSIRMINEFESGLRSSMKHFATDVATIIFSLVISLVTALLAFFLQSNIGAAFVLAVVALVGINLFFAFQLKAYTPKGRKLCDEIDGFCLFLSTTEKERLASIGTPPTQTPELYEKYLPYAIALNVESQWSTQFAPVFARLEAERTPYTPIWFYGLPGESFNLSSFAYGLSNSLSSTISSSSSAPGSSSGSGGGGSSGGGGGGGGGGGW